jgi:serine/threonine protein kinase
MTATQACPECGVALPDNAPEGLCPQCLLKQAAASGATPSALDEANTGSYARPLLAPPPEQLATHFPHLEVLGLLGQGGMGAVYQARQRKLDRLVALKVLPPEVGGEPTFAERFQREARALARLNHPRIVGVHDFGDTEDLYYFLMEFVDGGNLRQLMSARRIEPAEAAPIVAQVCEALQYAHDEGVVHRDIKPENILVDRKNGVKIADFGLARLVSRSPADFSLTGSRQVMGTPYYMAPEQMDRPQQVDHRADIYSVGVVLYELLTGRLPLGNFRPPSQEAGVDARFDAIVLRALAREPEQRYQHVRELKSALDALATTVQPGPVTGKSSSAAAVREPVVMSPVAAGSVSRRVPALRFSNGCLCAQGLLRLEENGLHLEYRQTEVGFWSNKDTFRENTIPLQSIEAVRLEKGSRFWNTKLFLTSNSLKALEPFPGYERGEIWFNLNKNEPACVEQFVAALKERLGLEPNPAAQPHLGHLQESAATGPGLGKPGSFFRSLCGYFITGVGQKSLGTPSPPETAPSAPPQATDLKTFLFGMSMLSMLGIVVLVVLLLLLRLLAPIMR